jgi:hypothetical protein
MMNDRRKSVCDGHSAAGASATVSTETPVFIPADSPPIGQRP